MRLMQQQSELHQSVERILAWAGDHEDVFAGLWLDNDGFLAGTGPVRIGVGIALRSVDEVRPEIEALMDEPARLVLVRKELPEAALRAAQESVVQRWMQPQSPPPQVTGCGVDIDANALEVMLRQPDEDLEAQIRSEADVPVIIVYGYAVPR